MNNTISIKIITQEDVAAILIVMQIDSSKLLKTLFLKLQRRGSFPDKISQILTHRHKIGLTVCRLLYWEIK